MIDLANYVENQSRWKYEPNKTNILQEGRPMKFEAPK